MIKVNKYTVVHTLPKKYIIVSLVWELIRREAKLCSIDFEKMLGITKNQKLLTDEQAKLVLDFHQECIDDPFWSEENCNLRSTNVIYSFQTKEQLLSEMTICA